VRWCYRTRALSLTPASSTGRLQGGHAHFVGDLLFVAHVTHSSSDLERVSSTRVHSPLSHSPLSRCTAGLSFFCEFKADTRLSRKTERARRRASGGATAADPTRCPRMINILSSSSTCWDPSRYIRFPFLACLSHPGLIISSSSSSCDVVRDDPSILGSTKHVQRDEQKRRDSDTSSRLSSHLFSSRSRVSSAARRERQHHQPVRR
jgi:hypothetical protein